MKRVMLIRFLLWSLFLIGCCKTLKAGPGDPVIQVLDGSKGQIAVDSFNIVEDSLFFDTAYNSKLTKPYNVTNQITLKIDESSPYYYQAASFTANVTVRIIWTKSDLSIDSTDILLTTNFSPNNGYSYDNYINKYTYRFNGGYRVLVKVVDTSSGAGSTIWKALKVENQLQSYPIFIFSCSNDAIQSVSHASLASNTTLDELPVSWGNVIDADFYDLEWTYIDSSALSAGRYGDSTHPDSSLVFANSATRVTITGTSYNIPLMYDGSGSLFFRVRPVQNQPGGGRTEGSWSSNYFSTGGLGRFDYKGHQRNLNWRATTTYAEEGKRKVVVQYYDGSLRSRQTVTKDNSTLTTIVAETYYDYQGRPAIQVMPAPTLNTVIGYAQNFNMGMYGPYDKGDFDTLPNPSSYCSIKSDSMLSDSGAALYYSPNNPLKDTLYNKFIPDSKGYPFSQTEYTQDNTGRISRQGGVDSMYQLGTGHETKYFYGTPDQAQLDALFGTEVGDHSHYYKTMVRDANGQYSNSYTDMRGRTIATSLAGTPDSVKLDKLPSNTTMSVTESLLDSSSQEIKDLVIESQKGLLVPLADTYTFNYSLNPQSLSIPGCNNSNVCYDCLYNLEIKITDACNNVTFDTTVQNFSMTLPIDTACTDTSGFNFSFSRYLQEGSYDITKKLSLSQFAEDYYRDSFFIKTNTCKNQDSFLVQQQTIEAGITQCKPSCSSCLDSLGTWSSYRTRFMQKAGIAITDTAQYDSLAYQAYQQALTDCNDLCDSVGEYEDVYNEMLLDLTAPSGQYAITNSTQDKYSIFYTTYLGDSVSQAPPYTRVTNYLNQDGKLDSVYDEATGSMVPPQQLGPQAFSDKFKLSWALALLPYHPEFCKLLYYQQLDSSLAWNQRFESVDTYAQALAKGYLNPTNDTSGSPYSHFYATGTIDKDPLDTCSSHSYKSDLENQLKHYSPSGNSGSSDTVISMWALATAEVRCSSQDPTCFRRYNNIDSAFNSNMCAGDLDMAWRNFRQMYLDVKRKLIDSQINLSCSSSPTAATLVAAGHQPHFSEAATLLTANGITIPTDTVQLNAQQRQAQDSVGAYYNSNCQAYVTAWWQELGPCKYSATDSAIIIPELIQVCEKGSDPNHPYGSSSISPDSSNAYNSFEQVLQAYNLAHGISDTTCNAYSILAPKPYNQQVIYGAKPVWTVPDSCDCKQISNLYTSYQSVSSGYTSFSDYLNKVYQTSISDSVLNQLRSLCSGDTLLTCNYLQTPIQLPPALQCGAGDVCANCQRVSSLNDAFHSQFPGINPVANPSPTDSTQLGWNQLFEQFMNYNLGFSKHAWEYLAFMDSCHINISDTAHYDTSTVTNNQLQSLMQEYYYLNIHPSGGYVDLDMRTFMGNITPSSGPKGVFDVNGNLIGNTIDSTTTLVNQSFASIWNSSPVDSVIGTLTYLTSTGRFRLYLKEGQTAPCGGIVGMRYYQFDEISDTLDGVVTGLKSYIDYGDGNKFFINQNYSDSITVILNNSYHGYGNNTQYAPFVQTVRWFPTIHYYSGSGPRTVTVYHTDIKGFFSVSNSITPDAVNLVGLKNLRGYMPQDTRYFGFMSTQDSSFNTTKNIHNFSGVNSIQYIDFLNGGGSIPNAYPKNNNFDSFQNNHNLLVVRTMLSPLDSSGRPIKEWLPRLATNFTHLNLIQMYQTVGQYTDDLDISIIPKYFVTTGFLTSGQVDSILIEKANGLTTLGVINIGSNAQNRTSASDVAVDSLTARGWTLVGAGMSIIGSPPTYTWTLDLDSVKFTDGFTDFFNTKFGTSMTYNQVNDLYTRKYGTQPAFCTLPAVNGLTLCGRADTLFPAVVVDSINSCSDSSFFSISKSTVQFNDYSDSINNIFDSSYRAKCLKAINYESFTVTHMANEYHYTLYYYDQAGNLLKTVPPAGVDLSKFGWEANWSDSVASARNSGQVLVPSHSLPTNYRYNTLNQVMAQKTPDAGQSHFWYDRLGRLAISQNAKQYYASGSEIGREYSYTLYDYLGRITEVGEISNATSSPMTDSISRNDSSLLAWIASSTVNKEQITQTVYDTAYAGFVGISPQPIVQRNLRNRVSYTSITSGNNPANYNQGSFYTYDIEGNADTLVQDYGADSGTNVNLMNANGHRFKKFVYNFDLISGKVNMMSYQPGWTDGLMHLYTYDAENRLTQVQTSFDSVNFETDARYQYYKHGPLARLVLGDQQVQGVDYAYTLQGWLKGVNSIALDSLNDMGGDGLIGGANQYVARDAYGFNLNYFAGDYRAINTTTTPFPGTMGYLPSDKYKPLFNGNISSTVMSVGQFSNSYIFGGPTLLYNYTYDQLNRITGMDVANNFNPSTNSWLGLDTILQLNEKITYDPNGNILKYRRVADDYYGNPMDSLGYHYYPGTNRLSYISDSVPSGSAGYYIDLNNQTYHSNYGYDSIGNLTSDSSEGISNIKWNVYGKILEITHTPNSNDPESDITFTYDAAGNRLSKITTYGTGWATGYKSYTSYVRDAQGNLLAIYSAFSNNSSYSALDPAISEWYLYGTSRLGAYTYVQGMPFGPSLTSYISDFNSVRGAKYYELTNHLDNVIVNITDKKIAVPLAGDTINNYFTADVLNAYDYYPFGSQLPGRVYSTNYDYRFGFNGKEKDDDVKNDGRQIDYGNRIYDPRVGRFQSVDPLMKRYPELTPFQFASNTPIQSLDLDGKERLDVTSYDATKRTTDIQIVKNVYINTNNIPSQVAALGNTTFTSIFSSGNTTLYVSEMPQNGKPLQFIDQKTFDKGTGYQLGISYNVTIQNTSASNTIDVTNAANTLVQSGVATQFSNPLIFARADANTTGLRTNNVYINPNYAGFNPPPDWDENSLPSYEELVAHEVGFHNMARQLHTPDKNGLPIYPTGKTLESNLPGQIRPNQTNTQAILNSALQSNNLNDPNNLLPKPPATDVPTTPPPPQ